MNEIGNELNIGDAEAMQACGAKFANLCKQGCCIYLCGELGTGKTTWARGFIHELGYQGNVKSPTYTLLEQYPVHKRTVLHLDLYRLMAAQELESIGLRDWLDEDTLVLIEWPERGEGFVPPVDIEVHFAYCGRARTVTARAISERGRTLVETLNN